MKNSILISGVTLALFAGVSLVSCKKEASTTMTYLPVKTEKNSNWGMIGPDGTLLFDDEFKSAPSPVFDNTFVVTENEGISVYTIKDGKPKVLGDLEKLASAGVMSDGVIPVTRKGQRIEYYDADGKVKFTLEPVKNKEIVAVDAYFKNGIATIMTEDDKWGAIDNSGKLVVEPKYQSVTTSLDGMIVAMPAPKEGETIDVSAADTSNLVYLILDKSGKEVAKVKGIEIMGEFSDGRVKGRKNDRLGFVDKKGEFTKVPEKVKNISFFNSDYYIFSNEDGEYGAMTNDGEIIVRAKYKELQPFGKDKFIGKSDNDKIYIINKKDEREKELDDLKDILSMKNYADFVMGINTDFELIGNEGDNEWKLYDSEGEPVSKTDYYEMGGYFPSIVNSDYFDATAAAEKMVSYVNGNGYNKVQLSQPLYKYISGGNPSQYTGTDKYYFEGLEGGYKYQISGYAYTNSYVAKSTPVYRTETYGYYYTYTYQTFDHYDYSWNQEAVVDLIRVYLNVYVDGQFENLKNAVVRAMAAKGYKSESNEKAYAVVTNGTTYAFISLNEGSDNSDVEMVMMTAKEWNSRKAGMIKTAIDRFNTASKSKSKIEYPEIEADSTIVEEVEMAAVDTAAVNTVAE
ncbi:MAG: WG repeat-containing protein [Candidatus Amulumruptor caecigallinarius]|nr:WG repeat-containing protein [Candidatus Amulumruptor caecigallinarius]